MFGAMKYIVIVIFVLYLLISALTLYNNKYFDGVWRHHAGNDAIEYISIEQAQGSYLRLSDNFMKSVGLSSPYITVDFLRTSQGGDLHHRILSDQDKLRADIDLSFIKLTNSRLVIDENDPKFYICGSRTCRAANLAGAVFDSNNRLVRFFQSFG